MVLKRAVVATVRVIVSAFVVAALTGFSCQEPEAQTGAGQWSFWGGNLHNTHNAESETLIGVGNVKNLKTKWVFETAGNVSAIPTVSENDVYVTDWGAPLGATALLGGGKLHRIDRETGVSLWSKSVSAYASNPLNNTSRSSPAIAGDLLIFGTLINQPVAALGATLGEGAMLYGVKRATGALVWKTKLDPHPLSLVTQSPVVYDGKVYVGVSSLEEAAAKTGTHSCCTFRGSMLSVDAATGQILWKTYMVPDNFGQTAGYSGAAVWGSAPSIDVTRGLVYIGTGNDYTVPTALADCVSAHAGDPQAQQTQCYGPLDAPTNYADAIVALDLTTGSVRWAQKFQNYGAWTFACDPRLVPYLPTNRAACKDLDSLDFDFGQAPMIYTAAVNGHAKDLLGVGQKSGVFYALDPDASGAIVWSTAVGPGAALGGVEFGSATDGKRIYVQNTNFDHIAYPLRAGAHAGETVNGGTWAALDAGTGELLWQTPDPSSSRPLTGILLSAQYGAFKGPGFFAAAMGPITVANGVMYAGSMDPEGHMYAFDGATGAILWSFASGGSVMSAPSIVNGVLYWGSGYSIGFNNNKLYAFTLP